MAENTENWTKLESDSRYPRKYQFEELENKVDNFQPLQSFVYKDTVADYDALSSLTGLEVGDGYVNAEDGLVYIWNGTSFPAEGDGLDVAMKPIGVVEEGNHFAVSGNEVALNTVTNRMENQAMLENQEYLKYPVLKDSEGNILMDTNAEFKIVGDIDRPDLSNYNIFIDAENYIINMEEIGNGQHIPSSDISFTDLYYNPSVQDSYSIGSSGTEWVSNSQYHERWEPFLNDSTYVTRELMGNSTEKNLPIYKYEFKPENPTRKVIMFGANHGSEKIPCVFLYRFFKNLIENYSSSPALQWARKNIHYVVVPLLSPDGYENRGRRVKETAPFPATWAKSGTVATVTFDVNDFPDTNPNVSATNYFSNPGIVDKTMISIINSSDQEALPDNGYLIKSALDGQTVTIDVPAGGSSSGTCDIYISVDPNRNHDMYLNTWVDSTPTGSIVSFNEPVAVRMDNKGTKAYSLNEAVIAKEIIDANSDATFLIDLHNGAADYDFRWHQAVNIDQTGIDRINDLHRLYTNDFIVQQTNNNTLSAYSSQMHGLNGFTAEWGQHSPVTSEAATDSQRWFGNLMISGAWFYNKKIQ